MRRIHKLPDELIAQIAAGEVVESPAAVIKEAVENSIDANAQNIEVIVLEDGFKEIQIRDDGDGILSDDLPLAISSFATSKIQTFDDLLHVQSMGFRGEALGSIASVSRLTLESKFHTAHQGYVIDAQRRLDTEINPSSIEKGTRLIIKDLFYNVPVRREYYQNASQIRKQLYDTLTQLALTHFQIAFIWRINDQAAQILPPAENLSERIEHLFQGAVKDLLPVFFEQNGFTLEGYISKFYFYRSHASDIRLSVNNRPVFFKPLVQILRNAYGELMPKGRFPFAVLFLRLEPTLIDVNIHPQKREIRFKHDEKITAFFRQAILKAIEGETGMRASNMTRMAGNHYVPQMNIPAADSGDRPQSKTIFSKNELLQFDTSPQASSVPQNLIFHSRLFNTFVLATNDEGIFLIDQHTMHERINYEDFLQKLETNQSESQLLAMPIQLTLGENDKQIIRESLPLLSKLGFQIEDLGVAGFALASIPAYLEPESATMGFEKILAQLITSRGQSISAKKLFDKMAKDLSCKFAIKKSESASLTDFKELLQKLSICENPARCPHGRPTIVKLDEKEVHAFFKRQAL